MNSQNESVNKNKGMGDCMYCFVNCPSYFKVMSDCWTVDI